MYDVLLKCFHTNVFTFHILFRVKYNVIVLIKEILLFVFMDRP